jgi:hypothetical protein
MFSCNYCENKYKFKSGLTRHIRQIHIDIDKTVQRLNKCKIFKCDICNHSFTRNEYLKKHKINCNNNNNSNNNTNTSNQNNTLIIAPVQNKKINCNNTNNIINNIIINTLGNENMAKLTHNEIDRIFDDEINGIITCVDYIYFNKNTPENHIFCTTAINDDYLSVYNTETNKVEKDTKKYFLDRVITLTIDKINTLFELHKKRFSKDIQNKIKTNIETLQQMKLCSSNKKLIKELIRGLNLLSYNKKEIINKTWMGEQPEKLTFDEILDLEYGPDEILESSNEKMKELINTEINEMNMNVETKKSNLKKPKKEKLLNSLKSRLMKKYDSDSESNSSDSDVVEYIEIVYKGENYIFDDGKLYNKTKIGLKGKLFGKFKNGKVEPIDIEL